MVDETNIVAGDVTNAGMYLFTIVLTAIASLATLIILVAVLTILLGKLGFLGFIKMSRK